MWAKTRDHQPQMQEQKRRESNRTKYYQQHTPRLSSPLHTQMSEPLPALNAFQESPKDHFVTLNQLLGPTVPMVRSPMLSGPHHPLEPIPFLAPEYSSRFKMNQSGNNEEPPAYLWDDIIGTTFNQGFQAN